MADEKEVINEFVRDTSIETSDDRISRSIQDSERELQDGTLYSMEERKAFLRQEWKSDILPNIPNDSKFHYCWLSTTNATDPIYRRLRIGYELVKHDEMPRFGIQNRITSGEFEGCVSINEMILARLPLELYQELMTINHYEKPLEEEELLKANVLLDEEDSEGRNLGQIEGSGISNLGRRVRRPSFI